MRQLNVGVCARILDVFRIERLYALSERLRAAAPATLPARALAQEFGVSHRTIERDIATLRLAGAPLYGQVGRGGGTASAARPRQAVIALEHTEIAALIIATHLAGPSPYGLAARRAIDKLLAVLGDHERDALEQLRSRFRIAAPTDGFGSPRIRSVIEDSVQNQTIARISYTDRHGHRTTRRIEPVGFYSAGGHWSVIAWCHLRDAGRLFMVDRVNAAHRTKQLFAARDVNAVLGWVPTPGDRP